MSHILGVYWAPGHQRQADIEYMQRLQPPAIRILDPDVNQVSIAHRAAPNALLLPRDWALSEQHDDVRRDPVGTGKRHANEWWQKLERWRTTGLQLPPLNQIVVVGINEPQVWTMLQQTVDYNVAWLDECARLGMRACALNLSVGWPANHGGETPPDWTPYAPIEAAIKRGNHFLVLHEYWYRTGPRDGWGWFAGRLQHCPWDVPIIIGECGIDMYVDMKRWENDGKPNRGWRGNVDAEQYAIQMEDYARSIDKRVKAILPFLTDYRANNWESFDTLEAHGRFLARKDRMVPQANPPSTPQDTRPPTGVDTQPTPVPAYVLVFDGVNMRNTPEVTPGNIVAKLPFGEQVAILDRTQGADKQLWAHVLHGKTRGFIRDDLLGAQKPLQQPPAPAPSEPVASGDKWTRSIAFVRRWEGGWADDPNDPGGATNKGITLGTYKRWQALQGKPEPTKDDLRALTDAEADTIYREWYWRESGADQLSWPLALAHFDTAVNAGVGTAQKMLQRSNGSFLAYMAHLIDWYTRIDNFEHFGRAWIRRRADLLLEASK